MKIKPFFILNLSNVDFIFDYLNENNYTRGEDAYSNEYIRKITKEDLRMACEIKSNPTFGKYQEYRLTFIELYEDEKLYVIYSKWYIKKDIIKVLLDINNLTMLTSVPEDYLGEKAFI